MRKGRVVKIGLARWLPVELFRQRPATAVEVIST